MPNRIIHEKALYSHSMAGLSDGAERLFWRLSIVADDHGRFDAHAVTLKARCFPAMVDRIQTKKVESWRDELASQQLIALYELDTRMYGYFVNWSKYQRSYGLASKFPDPPENPSIPSEKSIHDLLYEQLKQAPTFCGKAVKSVQRNVRAGSGYADLVILTEFGRIIVELKRTQIESGAINQLNRYRASMKDVFCCVAIGTGITAKFAISHALNSDVAVIVYDTDGKTNLIIRNNYISECADLLMPVKRCEFTSPLLSDIRYPIIENRDPIIDRAVPPEDDGTASRFQEFWQAYPSRNGKKLEKSITEALFRKLSIQDQALAVLAARNYAEGLKLQGISAKDPKRFFKDEYWREWVSPSMAEPVGLRQAPIPPFPGPEDPIGRSLWRKSYGHLQRA